MKAIRGRWAWVLLHFYFFFPRGSAESVDEEWKCKNSNRSNHKKCFIEKDIACWQLGRREKSKNNRRNTCDYADNGKEIHTFFPARNTIWTMNIGIFVSQLYSCQKHNYVDH